MALVIFPRAPRHDPALDELLERFEQAREARMDVEPQWHINLAYYLGHQWVEWDPLQRKLITPNVPPWRVMATTNMIRSSVRTEFAKLTKQTPLLGVVPQGPDPKQIAQARAADKIREYLWDRLDTYHHAKTALLWALVCGTGAMKVFWNPQAGEIIDTEEGPLPLGEIENCAVSPFELYPDPLADSFESAAWIIHAKIRSVEWVMETFGVSVEPEDVSELRLAHPIDLAKPGRTGLSTPKDAVVLLEYWEPPSAKNPEGRYTVFTRSRILLDGPHIYLESGIRYPFAIVRHIPVPGRIWGDSTVTDAIDPQTQYNKTRSQMLEIKNLMAKPKWLIPRGSMETAPTTAPGEILEYSPVAGLKPEMVQPPEVPSSYYRELEQLRAEIYELTGQHEVSRAINPAGARSGLMVAYLQEQDDTRLHPTYEAFIRMLEKLETMKLRLARVFYTEPRTARIVGENDQVEVFEFHGRDIPEDVDVKVKSGYSLPQSRLARQEFILQLWDRKLIMDPRLILRLLEFGNEEGVYEDIQLDTAQAQREHEQLKAGQWVEPRDFHNHDIHIYEHDRFRKTAEYEELPPDIQALFDRHVEMHKQLRQQVAMENMGLLMGAPTEGGEVAPTQPVTPQPTSFLEALQTDQTPPNPQGGF